MRVNRARRHWNAWYRYDDHCAKLNAYGHRGTARNRRLTQLMNRNESPVRERRPGWYRVDMTASFDPGVSGFVVTNGSHTHVYLGGES